MKREEDQFCQYWLVGLSCQDVLVNVTFASEEFRLEWCTHISITSWCETRCDVWLMAFLKVWTPKCWANCKKGQRHHQTSEQISPEKARVWHLGLVSQFHWNSLIICYLSGWFTFDGCVLSTLSRGKKKMPSSKSATKHVSRCLFQFFFSFTTICGKISNLTSIFFRWVGSTTN